MRKIPGSWLVAGRERQLTVRVARGQLAIDNLRLTVFGLFGIDSPPLEQISVSDLEYSFVQSKFPGECRRRGLAPGTGINWHRYMPRKGSVMIRIGRRIGFPVPCGPGVGHVVDAGLKLQLDLAVALGGRETRAGFSPLKTWPGAWCWTRTASRSSFPLQAIDIPSWRKARRPRILRSLFMAANIYPPAFPRSRRDRSRGRTRSVRSTSMRWSSRTSNSVLATSRLAVVDTPTQNYLVEFLPRRAHSGSSLDKAVGTASDTVNELSHLLNTGSAPFTKLTQSGMNDLEKFLHISSKTSTLTPSLNLEAQVLGGHVLPAAIPEPSTWMVFAGLIAGAALLRTRLMSAPAYLKPQSRNTPASRLLRFVRTIL